ncbi:MAG: DUF6624 domain-containing protein [Saprospiraceae bacterium]
MKRLLIGAMFMLFSTTLALCQNNELYTQLINEAFKLYQEKEYRRSAEKYSEAFVALGNKGMINDRYNAACLWALAEETDSSFIQLFKTARNANYTNYGHITSAPDLNSLHQDPRWKEVLTIIKANKEKAEVNFDKPLVAILDTIMVDDQKYRLMLNDMMENYAWDSKEMRAHLRIMLEKDSINVIKVTKILDERGWLGADVIGPQGNQALFLVIQHADISVQQKYLPMMRAAAEEGKASASNLALLEDRVALGTSKKQIYGSQIGTDPKTSEYYVMELKSPGSVDKRRAKVGLGTMQSYVSTWNMTWDVKEYKKKLGQIKSEEKDK